jgi:hypothetical protein
MRDSSRVHADIRGPGAGKTRKKRRNGAANGFITPLTFIAGRASAKKALAEADFYCAVSIPNSGQGMNSTNNFFLRGAVFAQALLICAAAGLTPAQSAGSQRYIEVPLYSFQGTDGWYPRGALIQARGAFYGTTYATVFELQPPTGEHPAIETTLYTFQGGNDGAIPWAGLVSDSYGALYGTTSSGGGTGCNSWGCGTVFKLTPPVAPATQWIETVLYRFSGGADGSMPFGSLVLTAWARFTARPAWAVRPVWASCSSLRRQSRRRLSGRNPSSTISLAARTAMDLPPDWFSTRPERYTAPQTTAAERGASKAAARCSS